MASTSKQTEKTSEIPPCEGTEMDLPPEWFTDGDPPPRYLQPYLLKMKNEIKKEILEELLQGSQGELPTIKPGATAKVVENQSDFQGEVIHTGIFCDNCDQLIHGIRYKCGNCSDFDLCQECESLPNIHNKNHIFLKIRYPVALKMYLKQLNQDIVTCPNPAKVYLNSRSRQSKKLYEAKFVCDETIPDSTVLPPSTKFVKSWRVVNSGTRVWTHATKLHLIQGNMALTPVSDYVDVPHLKPGEEGIVSVLFTTPSYPGVFRSHWNFCHKSRPFGDIVWCHIVVVSPEEVQNATSGKQINKMIISSKKSKMTEQMKYCHFILAELLDKKNEVYAKPFYKSVFRDHFPEENHKTLLCLDDIKAKLDDSKYTSPEDFAVELRRMFTDCINCCPGKEVVIGAKKLQDIFEMLYAMMPDATKKVPVPLVKTEVSIDSSESSSTDSEEDNKQEIQQLPDIKEGKKDEVSCIEQVLTAVKKEHERGNMVPRKLVVSSHTTTPNNTPFDLTPPKSPDHHATSMKEVHNMAADNSSLVKDSENEDDDCSVLSLGSSESDAEFVVIPMPKCFNLAESYVSQHMPHWFQDLPPVTATNHPGKNMHKVIQMGDQEIGVISAESMHNCAAKTAGTVSQETGVPEVSFIPCVSAVLEMIEGKKTQHKHVSVGTDGSSSEVSIIESGSNSPTIENATQTIESIHINLSSESATNAFEIDKVEVHVDSSPTMENIQQEQIEIEEQSEDIAISTTFPKFPVEFVNSTYDPSPASNEERTVQVLPEGLVTGALSAAASVFNTAKAVISTMQQPRNSAGACLSQELPSVASRNETHPTVLNPMNQLIEMGFCNRQQNEDLLAKHNGDVALVVAELVNLNDNDWYASRHIPSPPPCFD
ncbi:hypothetical protein CDAR_448092 [Caerostris darwini]|uniref:Next to BRCA1 gene 1 protein n=1 Tax=Caerostris darwini TaxID=1538125 RepID=A0AAV4W3Y0_9ARAC|nr:hypothetical protein CDAR_448092 [Caerostris darwini]